MMIELSCLCYVKFFGIEWLVLFKILSCETTYQHVQKPKKKLIDELR